MCNSTMSLNSEEGPIYVENKTHQRRIVSNRLPWNTRTLVNFQHAPHGSLDTRGDTSITTDQLQRLRQTSSHTNCMATFYGSSIQCIGMCNGSVSIGDWMYEDRHRIYQIGTPSESAIKTLFYHSNHILAGLDDGSIFFFDVLRNVIVQKEYFHRSQVLFFGFSPETSSIYSASSDGHIVVYNSYRGEKCGSAYKAFPVHREYQTELSLSCALIFGKCFIIGTRDGKIWIGRLEAPLKHPMLMQSCKQMTEVTSMCKVDQLLAIGYSSGSIRLYEVDDSIRSPIVKLSKIVNYHEHSIKTLYYETFSHSLWSADICGIILNWDVTSRTKYHIRSSRCVGDTIKDVCFVEIAHALNFWTLSSTGENISWETTWNVASKNVECAMKSAKCEITSTESDLHSGFNRIDEFEKKQEIRLSRYGRVLAQQSDRRLMIKCFFSFQQFYVYVNRIIALKKTCDVFYTSLSSSVLFHYWRNFKKNVNRSKLTVMEMSSFNLCQNRQLNPILSKFFYEWVTHAEKLIKKSRVFNRKQMITYSKIQCEMKKSMFLNLITHTKRFQIQASSLEQRYRKRSHIYNIASLKAFYDNLKLHQTKVQRLVLLQKMSDYLLEKICSSRLSLFVQALLGCSKRVHRETQLRKMYIVCYNVFQRRSIRLSYRKIMEFNSRFEDSKHKEIMMKYNSTVRKIKAGSDYIESEKSVNQLKEQLCGELIRLETTKKENIDRTEYLKSSVRSLHHQIALEIERAAGRTVTDRLVKAISLLKCRAINFDKDFLLIQKIVDRVSTMSSQGSLRIFLAAHLDIKRVIVSALGEQPQKKNSDASQVDLVYTWGKKKEEIISAVSTFPPHTHSVVLEATKKMVIAFDILQQCDLHRIDTDEEIVANAAGLITMFDYLQAKKHKKILA